MAKTNGYPKWILSCVRHYLWRRAVCYREPLKQGICSLVRLFSDKINHCASGSPENYSEVYCLCVYLSKSFINADFDKAFQMVHDSKLSKLGKNGKLTEENAEEVLRSSYFKTPDLSDCLYE